MMTIVIWRSAYIDLYRSSTLHFENTTYSHYTIPLWLQPQFCSHEAIAFARQINVNPISIPSRQVGIQPYPSKRHEFTIQVPFQVERGHRGCFVKSAGGSMSSMVYNGACLVLEACYCSLVHGSDFRCGRRSRQRSIASQHNAVTVLHGRPATISSHGRPGQHPVRALNPVEKHDLLCNAA